ncbi:hypothetical protein LQZ18_04750 [Lachnospiraceae bacterium ZAX-1]
MNNKEAIKKLVKLLKDYKQIIAAIICCLFVSTIINLYVPLLSRQIMDDGFLGGNRILLVKLVLCSFLSI